MANSFVNASRLPVLALGFAVLTGCATVPAGKVNDPYEDFNRSMFSLNDNLDRVILKPVATVYKAVLPSMVRAGVGNFFSNLAEPWVAVNSALQLKGQATFETIMRFAVNTVFGIGGVMDIATELRLERRNEDFGQTLGYWGVGSGPYLMLPFFGPSTLRDSFGQVVDYRGDPLNTEPNVTTRDTASALRLIDFRASLLRAGDLLEGAALDKYTFTRDVFLQRRKSLVYDGQEPPEPDEPAQPAAK